MVKDPAIYRLSSIYHFWHFLCNFCVHCIHFFIFGRIFYMFNNEDFCVHFSSIFCLKKSAHFLHFSLPPIVEVDNVRYRDNIGDNQYGESYNIGINNANMQSLQMSFAGLLSRMSCKILFSPSSRMCLQK